MKTETQPARASGPTVEAGPGGRARRTSWVVAFVVLGVTAMVVMAVLLSIYPRKELDVPVGWDLSEYLWRTTRAQDVGLAGLSQPLPSVSLPKSGRPAFPVVAGTLSSLFGMSPFRLAFVLPSVMAAVIGLAAGAFLGGVLRRPLSEVVAATLAVSLSSLVVRLMMPEGYMDTMFAAAVFLAALVPVLLSLERRAALLPAVLLVGAGAVIHWSFFAFVAATLLLTGAALLPVSWRRWRSSETAWWDTPTARLGGVLLGGAAIGGGALYGLLGRAPQPRTDVSEFAKKLRRDLPKYHLPFTIPAAVVGAGSLGEAGRTSGEGRFRAWTALALLASWCAVVAGGYVAMTVFGADIPAHRFLSFGLAIPLLGILGVLGVARLIGRVARPVGWAVVALALGASAFVAYGQWYDGQPWTDGSKIRDAEVAAAYLDAAAVPADRAVVYILSSSDYNGAGLMSHMLRAGLPSDRIETAYVYIGSAEGFLARRPDDTAVSRSYFSRVRGVFGQDPVALILPSFNERYYEDWVLTHPDSVVQNRIAVVRGPSPPAGMPAVPVDEPTVGTMSPLGLGVLAVAMIGVLFLVGAGWSLLAFRRLVGPAEVLALAPAVGVAAVVVWGVVLDRLGAHPGGLAGALVPVVAGVAGWIAFGLFGRGQGRAGETPSPR